MGKTSFSGPVYGAKSVLLSFHQETVSSGTGDPISTAIFQTIVPAGQDWYVTEFQAAKNSTGSTGFSLRLDDDSTQLSSIAFASSLANQNTINILTADGGEYEGQRVVSGSTVRVIANTGSSGLAASSGISVTVHGFIRLVDSSRAS